MSKQPIRPLLVKNEMYNIQLLHSVVLNSKWHYILFSVLYFPIRSNNPKCAKIGSHSWLVAKLGQISPHSLANSKAKTRLSTWRKIFPATQTHNYKGLIQKFHKDIDYVQIIQHIILIMFQIIWIQEF